MTTQHTPGPWEHGISTSGHAAIFAEFCDGNTDIASPIGLESTGGEDWTAIAKEEAEANIRLICAAPDLLSALETLASRMTENPDGTELYGDWIAMAEEAIAKAKGGAA